MLASNSVFKDHHNKISEKIKKYYKETMSLNSFNSITFNVHLVFGKFFIAVVVNAPSLKE